MIVKSAADRARFDPAKMGKADLASGEQLFAGLNSFEAGQEHAPHAHCDRDKLYLVLQGRGTLTLGGETTDVGPGDVALARAGIVHGLRNPGPGRLVALVVIAPPPAPAERQRAVRSGEGR